MSHQSAPSTPFRCFVLADSHAKLIPPVSSTPSHQLTVASISGLKWVDDHHHHLSAIHQIHSPHISHCLTSSNAIMLLIGSNSLRSFHAPCVLDHVRNFLTALRQTHPHLSSPQSICIVTTFPCGKPSNTFLTPPVLQRNIDNYNYQLQSSSESLQITVVDFHIQPQHLNFDRLHLHRDFSHLIPDNIFQHFHTLASSPPVPPTRQPSRSAAGQHRRNQLRYARRAATQARLYICREIHHPWTLPLVKTYCKNNHLPVAKISPIRKNQLRLRFNNDLSLQVTHSSLPKDFFSSANFSLVFP